MRNCIEQELVMIEIKTMLVLTIKEFDIVNPYDEWDNIKRNPKG
jgi:hypothetical protein